VKETMSHRYPLTILGIAILAAHLACDRSVETPPAQRADTQPPAAPAEARMAAPLQDGGDEAAAGASGGLCPDLHPPAVTHRQVLQTPDLPEPPARVPSDESVFKTCLVRLTDRKADIASEDSSKGLKNEYSRVQAFNADGSRILIRGIEATWYLYDARTLKPLGLLPFGGSVDPRWDARDPQRLYYTDEKRLMAYQVRSREQTVVHDFTADFPGKTLAAVWTRYEGSPSMDGRYWGLMAQDNDWKPVALLIYDQQRDKVIAVRELGAVPDLDTVTISPRGDYFLAYFEYCESGKGTVARPCGLMVYDRNLERGRGLLRIVGHSDLALDAAGREVLVYQDIDTDHISMLDLASGAVTPLWPIDFSHTGIGLHFSGRAFNRPGWALVSTYNGGHPRDHTWMDDQVFAVELKRGGRVARLAHTQALVDETQEHDYWAEPHASVNPDFTRVLFTTNWGRSGTGEVETFLVALPQDWTERLP
jgi:hypothetical protein